MNIQAIILAAGKSSRFRTEHTKLSFLVCGQEMILYPVKLARSLGMEVSLIVGYQKERIKNIIDKAGIDAVSFIEQTEQKGTGHALMCSKDSWQSEHILVMNGDTPLINNAIIHNLIDSHVSSNAAVSFVAGHNVDPTLEGYGRVVNENGQIKIVEARNFTQDPTVHCCVNAGIYLFRKTFLEQYAASLTPDALSNELFITDLVHLASSNGLVVNMVSAPFDLVRGINTLRELWAAEHIKRSELINYWMEHGVRFSGAQNTFIDVNVEIGSGSFIGAGVLLINNTKIGKNCYIDAFSLIDQTVIHDNVFIHPNCVIRNSEVKSNAAVGPFAHVRNNSCIDEHAVVGNFVEVNASTIGGHSKAKHLSYLGNAQVGQNVNIGAGTITCNYDGFRKHATIIQDGAQIGSNNSLVAPVTIGQEAITAAGSTITENVPADALAIARARQVTKEHYASHLRAKCKQTVTPAKSSIDAL